MSTLEQPNEKEGIEKLFNRIAPSYDGLNHLFSMHIDRYWRWYAVRGMSRHEHVLDVAVGTADLALALLRKGRARQVTGIDLSKEMLAIGRQKVQGQPVQLLLADAQQMPFDDGTFDAVTCGFGVRNFARLDDGLHEMYRVLKDGGEMMILEFSYPDNPLIRRCYEGYLSRVMPFIGSRLSHDKTAFRYLNRSVKTFLWGNDMVQRLQQAGFCHVTYTPLTFGIATVYRGEKKLKVES